MQTDHGMLRLHDPRRFGAVVHVTGEEDPLAHKLLDGLGMGAAGPGVLPPRALAAGLQASRTPIKQLLLGGKLVVGVGNIYASEVLFLARIDPQLPAREVGPRKVRRLFDGIREVLALAVAQGGTTLRDFSSADGMPGHFQLQAKVYGRDGQPCVGCGRRPCCARAAQHLLLRTLPEVANSRQPVAKRPEWANCNASRAALAAQWLPLSAQCQWPCTCQV